MTQFQAIKYTIKYVYYFVHIAERIILISKTDHITTKKNYSSLEIRKNISKRSANGLLEHKPTLPGEM